MPEELRIETEGLCVQLDFGIFALVQQNRDKCGEMLAEHGRERGARNAEFRRAEEAEDQHRVHHKIKERAGELGVHRECGAAGRLQKALKGDFREDAERAAADNARVENTVGENFGVGGLRAEKRHGEKDAGQHKEQRKAELE